MFTKILVSTVAAGTTAFVYMNVRKPEKDMAKKAQTKGPGVIKDWGSVWFK